MFGFNFQENFDLPYTSKSISEFWRRWHITLGSFFRDYVYIPLGGSRMGNVYFNLFIVVLLTGLWHGASWNFLLWGMWHCIFILIERLYKKRKFCLSKKIPDFLYRLRIPLLTYCSFFHSKLLHHHINLLLYLA